MNSNEVSDCVQPQLQDESSDCRGRSDPRKIQHLHPKFLVSHQTSEIRPTEPQYQFVTNLCSEHILLSGCLCLSESTLQMTVSTQHHTTSVKRNSKVPCGVCGHYFRSPFYVQDVHAQSIWREPVR